VRIKTLSVQGTIKNGLPLLLCLICTVCQKWVQQTGFKLMIQAYTRLLSVSHICLAKDRSD